MYKKAIAIATNGKGGIQHFGIGQCLLHAVSDRKTCLLGFNDCNRYVGAGVQNKVSPLWAAFVFGILDPSSQLAANHDSSIGEAYFFAELMLLPPCLHQRRRDEFCADIAFAELAFVHVVSSSALSLN